MTIKSSGLWCDLCGNLIWCDDQKYWNISIKGVKGKHCCEKCKIKHDNQQRKIMSEILEKEITAWIPSDYENWQMNSMFFHGQQEEKEMQEKGYIKVKIIVPTKENR